MNKIVTLLLMLSLVISLMIFTGCGVKNEKEAIKNDDNKVAAGIDKKEGHKKEEVTLRVFTRWSDDTPQSEAFRSRLALFMEANPHVTIKDISINDEAAFNDKWKASVATGDIPEVFQNYGGESFKQYITNNLLMDLTNVLESNSEWKDGFLPLFDNWQYDDVEGTYGVPYEFYAVGIFYNKTLFEDNGIQLPTTIEELMSVTNLFVKKDIVPMALGAKDSWRGGHLFNNLIMKKFGYPKIKALASREARYDDEDIVEVFEMMAHMNTIGMFGDNILGVDYNAEKEMFLGGKTAMHMDGSWFLGEAAASDIAADIGFIPFPYFEKIPENSENWAGGAGAGLSIAGNLEGAQKEAAEALLQFLTSLDHFAYIQEAAKGGVYPVKLESDESVIDPITVAYMSAIKDAVDFKGDVQQYDPLSQMLDRARNSIQGLLAGNSPENTAKEIVDEIDNN